MYSIAIKSNYDQTARNVMTPEKVSLGDSLTILNLRRLS